MGMGLQVRRMIREGKVEEARQMCEEQTNVALGQLQADPDWRKEYLELWMHQRPPPFHITFEDFDFDGAPICHAAPVKMPCCATLQCSAIAVASCASC